MLRIRTLRSLFKNMLRESSNVWRTDSSRGTAISTFPCALVCLTFALALPAGAVDPDLPELGDIEWIIRQDTPPPGVVFEIREYDEEALIWVAPRLEHYVKLLRERFPELPIALLSHGDEMLSLTIDNREKYPRVHTIARKLVSQYGIPIHACGTFAQMNGLSDDDFPDYIDVVPFGPSQLADYKQIGFEQLALELTW